MECWHWPVAAENDLIRHSYWSLSCISQWPFLPACTHWEAAGGVPME